VGCRKNICGFCLFSFIYKYTDLVCIYNVRCFFVIIETYELCAQTFFLRALPQNYAPIRATEQEEGGGSVRRLICCLFNLFE